jgi:hypothetical protein
MDFHVYVGLGWTIVGVIRLYRAISGARASAGLITFRHESSQTGSNTQRWINAVLGVFCLALGLVNLVSAFLQHVRHLS